MSDGSVTQWIDLFRTGDDQAALRLWKRYFAPLVSVARAKLGRMPGSMLDAEDVALSAFHALYRAASAQRLPELNDREGLWQMLMIIASGKVVDAKRREFSQKRGAGQVVRSAIELEQVLQGHESDPTVAAMIADQFEHLLGLLEEQELQEIALLKMEGFSNEEIGTKLQASERTIKRRLAMIRRIWEDRGVAPAE